MNTLRIGVMDKETPYVERLCAYLNRFGNGMWNAVAFTDEKVLKKQMHDRRVDLLMTTKQEIIEEMNNKYPERSYVWLTEEKRNKNFEVSVQKIYMIYRYQSAKLVVDSLKDIVEYIGLVVRSTKTSAVIYSPIGRCGKTMLAKDFVSKSCGGKWLYVGMEDYGGVGVENYDAEDFLYYVKERRESEVVNIIDSCNGYIPSPFSIFDTRRLCREDIEWFLTVFEKEHLYRGVLFDMGTALIGSFDIMLCFDHIIIPYLNNKNSDEKIRHFKELISAYELDELNEKARFVEMNKGDESIEEMRRVLT